LRTIALLALCAVACSANRGANDAANGNGGTEGTDVLLSGDPAVDALPQILEVQGGGPDAQMFDPVDTAAMPSLQFIPIDLGFNASTGTAGSWTATATTGSIALNDPDHYASGKDCVRIATDGAGSNTYISSPLFGAIDFTNGYPVLAIKVTNTAALRPVGWMDVYASSDASANTWTNYVEWEWGTTSDVPSQMWVSPDGAWVLIPLPWNTASITAGTPIRSAIRHFRVRLHDKWVSGDPVAPAEIRIGAIGIARDPAQEFPNGVITISFDDATSSTYNLGYPVLAARGIRAVTYAISAAIDTGSFMTTAQLNTLAADGWDVSPHCNTMDAHTNGYPSMGPTAAAQDLAATIALHATRGWDTRHLAYPHGYFDAPTVAAIMATGIAAARTVYSFGYGAKMICESWPPVDKGKLMAYEPSNISLDGLNAMVDDVKANHSWGMPVLHNIIAGASTGESLNVNDLASFIDYAVSQGVPFRTMPQMVP
jgi:peptidoglycan/xylan/chitin deacetylase (PgdA/CDA1 family)